jgi:hypothetical protein
MYLSSRSWVDLWVPFCPAAIGDAALVRSWNVAHELNLFSGISKDGVARASVDGPCTSPCFPVQLRKETERQSLPKITCTDHLETCGDRAMVMR